MVDLECGNFFLKSLAMFFQDQAESVIEDHLNKKNVSPHEFLKHSFPKKFKISDNYGFFKRQKMNDAEEANIDKLHSVKLSTVHAPIRL